MSNFAKLVYEKRRALGITQQSLGELIGQKSGVYVSKIERGRISFPKKIIPELARSLGITIEEIIQACAADTLIECLKEPLKGSV